MNELIKFKKCDVHKVGLVLKDDLTFDEWQNIGLQLQLMHGSIGFWIGDWLNYGFGKFGEKASQAIEFTGFDYGSLANYKWVTKEIESSRRREKLSFSTHIEIASAPREEQDELLNKAENDNLSSREVRELVKQYKRQSKIELSDEQKSKFQNKVINGDCLIELKKIPDKSIDMIYCDPPYGVGKDTWDEFTDNEFKLFMVDWVRQAIRVLKDKSHLFINFDSSKVIWLENLISSEFGIDPVSHLIWHYRNLVKGRDAKNKLLNTHQPILHYNFGDKELNFSDEWTEERFDVWTIAIPQSNYNEGKFHITQKPIELLDRLVRIGSKEGEIVLDPMAGSGTTALACQKQQRDYIVIEKNEDYYKTIIRRLNGDI